MERLAWQLQVAVQMSRPLVGLGEVELHLPRAQTQRDGERRPLPRAHYFEIEHFVFEQLARSRTVCAQQLHLRRHLVDDPVQPAHQQLVVAHEVLLQLLEAQPLSCSTKGLRLRRDGRQSALLLSCENARSALGGPHHVLLQLGGSCQV